MGCCAPLHNQHTHSRRQSSPKDPPLTNCLKVVTLNYSQPFHSPYQYYCCEQQEELKEIGSYFMAIIPQYFPDFNQPTFNFKMGGVYEMRERYSPMFQVKAGIRKDGVVMSRNQFQQKWQEQFQQEKRKLRHQSFSEDEKQSTKLFDLAIFHTLLRYVYKVLTIQEAKGFDAMSYQKILSPFFELNFLNEDKKCSKFKAYLNNLNADIFCLQQYSPQLIEAIRETNEYYIAINQRKENTMIAARKRSFKAAPIDTKIFLAERVGVGLADRLNWAGNSAFMIIDNYIIISAQLDDDPTHNAKEILELKLATQQFQQRLTQFQLILAGDLNCYLIPFAHIFHYYPPKEEIFTTAIKHTFTQQDFSRADKMDRISIDKIISTLQIVKGEVTYISGEYPSQQALIPSEEHPFSHFLLKAYLHKRS